MTTSPTSPLALEGRTCLVTGGSRGLGLGLVEALVARKARVIVLGRDGHALGQLRERLGVSVRAGDLTDVALANTLLREEQPDVVVLNAGAVPAMAPLHQQTWEGFSVSWQTDVKGAFHWTQAALRTPLHSGSRVLIVSSGAAIGGSPLSGGYAGAKRMLWHMANYAHGAAAELGLGIAFQTIVPQQIVGETEAGRSAAAAYARRKGVTVEAFLAGFGAPLTPRLYGEQLAAILTEPAYASAAALGLKGEGIRVLEERAS